MLLYLIYYILYIIYYYTLLFLLPFPIYLLSFSISLFPILLSSSSIPFLIYSPFPSSSHSLPFFSFPQSDLYSSLLSSFPSPLLSHLLPHPNIPFLIFCSSSPIPNIPHPVISSSPSFIIISFILHVSVFIVRYLYLLIPCLSFTGILTPHKLTEVNAEWCSWNGIRLVLV